MSAVVSIEHPFDTNDDDHCETSLEAYRDVVPILNHIAAWHPLVRVGEEVAVAKSWIRPKKTEMHRA